MYQQPSDKVCAKMSKLYQKRPFACFPLKDIAAVLDQDLSGVKKQVTTQGGVLRLTSFWYPDGYRKRDLRKRAVQQPVRALRCKFSVDLEDSFATPPD